MPKRKVVEEKVPAEETEIPEQPPEPEPLEAPEPEPEPQPYHKDEDSDSAPSSGSSRSSSTASATSRRCEGPCETPMHIFGHSERTSLHSARSSEKAFRIGKH